MSKTLFLRLNVLFLRNNWNFLFYGEGKLNEISLWNSNNSIETRTTSRIISFSISTLRFLLILNFFWTNKITNWDSPLPLSLESRLIFYYSLRTSIKNTVLTCPSHSKINSHFRKEALDMSSSFGRFPWKCQSQTMAVHTMLCSSEALKRTTISTNMNLSVTMPTWSPIDYRNDIVAHTMTTMRSGRAINVKFPTSYILKFSWLSIMMAIGCTMAIMFRLSDTLCRSGTASTCAIVYWRDRRFASALLASSFRGWVKICRWFLLLLPHVKCKVFRDICNTGSGQWDESRINPLTLVNSPLSLPSSFSHFSIKYCIGVSRIAPHKVSQWKEGWLHAL